MEFAASGTHCSSAQLIHEAYINLLRYLTTALDEQIARCCYQKNQEQQKLCFNFPSCKLKAKNSRVGASMPIAILDPIPKGTGQAARLY